MKANRAIECLELVATVNGKELDAVAKQVSNGEKPAMPGWTVRQLNAVKTLVANKVFTV